MFDTEAALHLLSRRANAPILPAAGWPSGCPSGECARSPASALVAEWASDAGLFLFNYEHRAHLELPEDWVPEGQAELGLPPTWRNGVLEERKYQGFKHDQAIGGFHPGQRAKWTTHELCHGLVGWAWRPAASPLFLATAGRLAELLPVTLWYFLDECFLNRCEAHAEAGALHQKLCWACEAAARPALLDTEAPRLLAEAARTLDRELAAIARTRRLGRPMPFAWSTIDLCSDGLAYAAAHEARLGSEVFQMWVERFAVMGGGWSADLDALEARVVAVARGFGGEAVPKLAPSPAHGRLRWTLQDVGWRLMEVWAQTDGEAADALLDLVDALAELVPTTEAADADLADAEGILAAVTEDYRQVWEDYVVPEPEDVFGVGYDLPGGFGRSAATVADGIRSACPRVAGLLEGDLLPLAAAFAAEDAPSREGIGTRFSRWYAAREPGALAELARYEAAMGALGPVDEAAATLGVPEAARVVLADGMAIHEFGWDPVDLADGVAQGDHVLAETPTGLALTHGDGQPVEPRPTWLLLGRNGAGERLVLDLGPETSERLLQAGAAGLPPDDPALDTLAGLGALRPVVWPL